MAENDNDENNAHKSNAPFARKYDRNISSLRTDLQPDAAFRKPTVRGPSFAVRAGFDSRNHCKADGR